MHYPSRIFEKAVTEISMLPGIGKKTALRLALFLLRQDREAVKSLSESILALKEDIRYCRNCHNLSDNEVCEICRNPSRDHSMICVVEDIRDLMAIENTSRYKGVYHVLGGLISPMEGTGASDLQIDSLVDKVKSGEVDEVIFALSTTMEGDTTNFYIYRKLQDHAGRISTIARGIALGDELEYADEATLAQSISNRVPYASSLKEN